MAIGVGIGIWKKNWKTGVLLGYLFLILAETVLTRPSGELRYELVPFWSWIEVFKKWPLTATGKMYLKEILLNIVMFVPVGMLLGHKGRKSILIAFGISAGIELIQLVTHRGLFEFDDIIHNTLGAAIGFLIYVLLWRSQSHEI